MLIVNLIYDSSDIDVGCHQTHMVKRLRNQILGLSSLSVQKM